MTDGPDRPRYTDPEDRRAIIERIAARIEAGALNEPAARAEGISEDTRRRWCLADPELDAVHTRARSIGADALAEQAVGIAVTGAGPDGTRYADAQERRLAYDALRWLAGKRRPKDYGDKQQVEVSGGIEHLHLDALRAVSAKAMLDTTLPLHTSRHASLPSPAPLADPTLDTDDLIDTRGGS